MLCPIMIARNRSTQIQLCHQWMDGYVWPVTCSHFDIPLWCSWGWYHLIIRSIIVLLRTHPAIWSSIRFRLYTAWWGRTGACSTLSSSSPVSEFFKFTSKLLSSTCLILSLSKHCLLKLFMWCHVLIVSEEKQETQIAYWNTKYSEIVICYLSHRT
jgi:hypothetical protein